MTTALTYQYGEIVDLSIKGARVVAFTNGELQLELTEDQAWVCVKPAIGSVDVTRIVPADGEVHPGDLWRGKDGSHWFVIGGVTHPAFLDTVGRRHEYADVLRWNGPLERVHSARPAEVDAAVAA